MDETNRVQEGENEADAEPKEEPRADEDESSDQGRSGSENQSSDAEESSEAAGKQKAAETLEPLQEGSAISAGETRVPLRSLAAICIFLAAFMGAWMGLWALLGGIGLYLGWIGAAVIGALAVKLYADRVAAG